MSFTLQLRILFALALLLCGTDSVGAAPVVTYSIGEPSFTTIDQDLYANFQITMQFNGSPGDNVQTVDLDLLGNDAGDLVGNTGSAPAFIRFSFQPAVTNWVGPANPIPGINVERVSALNGRGVSPGNYLIGTFNILLVDFAPGSMHYFTIAGDPRTDAAGSLGGQQVQSFASGPGAGVGFAQPNGVTFTVPEPGGFALLALCGILGLRSRRSRDALLSARSH